MNTYNKNLIILGCQRSGKTTLSNMLYQKNNNYHIISTDALVHAFEMSLPNLNINRNSNISEKSQLFAPFIAAYLHSFKRNYPNQNYIIESCQLFPKHILEEPYFKNDKIICLGYPNATPEEIFQNIRSSDISLRNPYTKQMSDKELKKIIPIWIRYSQFLEKASTRNHIPFYETNKNRNQILNKIVNEITQEQYMER